MKISLLIPKVSRFLFGCVLGILTTGSVTSNAAIITSYNGGATAEATFYDSQISAVDLVNDGQASLSSGSSSSAFPAFTGIPGLNDGFASGATSGCAWYGNLSSPVSTYLPATITFTLNTNPGTGGSVTGWDITSINSFAGYPSSNLGAQQFTLYISTVSNSTFTQIGGDFANLSGFSSSTNETSLSTLTSLTDSTGVIASGVTGIRFVYTEPFGAQQSGAFGTMVREIDVFGTASVPEPGTIALIGTGFIVLLFRKRKTQ